MADTLTTSRGDSDRSTGERDTAPSARTAWPVSWQALGLWLGAYVVLTAVWSVVGLAVTERVEGTSVHEAETDVVEWFEAQRSEDLTTVSHWISFSGDAVPKTIFIGLLALAFVVVWRRTHEALFLLIVMGLEVAVFGTVSAIVGRDRPPVEQLDGSLPTASFPSGHVAASFALYGALAVIVWWRTREPAVRAAAAVAAVVWPAVMILIRLYRGMHYPSDTLMGALLGLVSIAVGLVVIRTGNRALARRRDDIDPQLLQLDQSGAGTS